MIHLNSCVEKKLEGTKMALGRDVGSYFKSSGGRSWWSVAAVEMERKFKFCVYSNVRIKRIS
jgi:hypothetical protein